MAMAFNFTLLLLLSAALLTTIVGYRFCKIQRETVICRSFEFCCGTCDDSYCCSDPKNKFTWEEQTDCSFKKMKIPENSPQNDTFPIFVGAFILGVVASIVLFLVYRVRKLRYGGQPMSTGPPPSYQEAVSPGYPVPIHDGGQATYPLESSLPTDDTSPQPAYNPSVVKTSN